MMSVLDPGLNRRVSLRYALLLLPLCSVALPLAGSGVDVLSWLGLGGGAAGASAALTATSAAAGPIVEPWAYALLSAPINAVMIHAAYKFWRHGTDKAARWCFWVSLVHLPAIMLLAMACKREMWNGVGEALGMGTTRVPAAAVGRMGGQGREALMLCGCD
ncbi:Protoheme IX farnesyltransferase, mitochondrial [Tilletia horrida]|nr:Protoheme IX farnesyltransferase, mitochondrial [Tilletia horrida]